jgi:hypothetical protein
MKRSKDLRGILLCVSLIFFTVSLAWSDGGYVSVSYKSAAISADQRAILIKNGNEISMTFSTGYTGEGANFGWIIPTPVPPMIKDVNEAGKEGEAAFEFLDRLTAPMKITYTHHGCFPAGTEVLTAGGLSPIERVSPGTEVYACDLTTDRWVFAKVLRRQAFEWEGDMVTIELGRHTLRATGNQPIYVRRGEGLSSRPIPQEISTEEQRAAGPGRWVEARDLRKGDVLKKTDDTDLIVTGLMSDHQKDKVYCLDVEQYHNCAVHREGILVHNEGKEAAAESSSEPLVTVYGRVILEHYEVSVLGAADASALLEWLQVNDYKVSSEAQEIFDNYIERNWAFVAVKLNPSEKRRYKNEFLPPLTIKYRHNELVYPLLISSISTTDQVKITLYVIAEGAVVSSNFRTVELDYDAHHPISEKYVERCIQNTTRFVGGEDTGLAVLWNGRFCPDYYWERIMDSPYYSDPSSGLDLINRLCNSPLPEWEMHLTRLEARMSPVYMTEDISFDVSPYVKDFEVRFH